MQISTRLHPIEARDLAQVEQELGPLAIAPAEAEIIRRVFAATGDIEFQGQLTFSSDALKSGAAALAARNTILVDVSAVQVAVMPAIQASFANPTYCCGDAITRPQREKTPTAWGLETLASRYPNAMMVVGQTPSTLVALGELVECKLIYPALVIATPPQLEPDGRLVEILQQVGIPYVALTGRKGNAMVAIAILTALIEMTWQAYGQDPRTGMIHQP
ncbi:MAG: precorrin-8X methylmutase [Synechococcales cyanobacterium RU_4_20]|nr:precorrin-8X methylmutase [Synechococcales cyanobacterium RU_4_20]